MVMVAGMMLAAMVLTGIMVISDDVELPWNHVDHPWGEASLLHKLGNCQTTEMLSTKSLILLDHDLLTIHSIENIITPSSQIIFAIFLTSVASAQPAS